MRRTLTLAIPLLLAATFLSRASSAAGAAGRAMLISVDDLPVAGGELHTDPAERARITEGLLAVLARHHVPAVGLVIWGNVKTAADQAILRRWLAAGHELGNHSAHHLDLTKTDAAAYIADVEAGRAGLAGFLQAEGKAERKTDGKAAGKMAGKTTVRFFRYPFLDEGETAAKLDAVRVALASSGQRSLPVTIDDQDWSFEKPWVEARRKGDAKAMAAIGEEYQETLRAEVRDQEERGDSALGRTLPQILLLHANEVGAAQWDRLFTWLEARGDRFATVDEVLADPVFAQDPHYLGPSGFGSWDRILAVRRAQTARADVEALLEVQSAAWNRGDLDAFTSVYAEDASFLTPTGLTRGRQQVLERYRHRYPGRAAMGTLTLEVIEVRPAQGVEFTVGGDARPGRVFGVSVAAHWRLAYPDQPEKKTAEGLTLLVFQRHGSSWQIVQDASM